MQTYHTHITSDHKWFDLKLKEVWRYRDLIWQFTKRSFTVTYKQTVLGPAWLFINPILTSLIKLDTKLVKDRRYGEDTFHFLSLIQGADSVAFLDKHLYNYYRNDYGASLGFEYRDFSYFNTRYVYALLVQIIKTWGIEPENFVNRILAVNFNDSIYYVLKYLRSATSLKRKNDCIKYDWTTYLIDSNLEIIEKNPYVRNSYVKVYKAFFKKRYLYIYLRENWVVE